MFLLALHLCRCYSHMLFYYCLCSYILSSFNCHTHSYKWTHARTKANMPLLLTLSLGTYSFVALSPSTLFLFLSHMLCLLIYARCSVFGVCAKVFWLPILYSIQYYFILHAWMYAYLFVFMRVLLSFYSNFFGNSATLLLQPPSSQSQCGRQSHISIFHVVYFLDSLILLSLSRCLSLSLSLLFVRLPF